MEEGTSCGSLCPLKCSICDGYQMQLSLTLTKDFPVTSYTTHSQKYCHSLVLVLIILPKHNFTFYSVYIHEKLLFMDSLFSK